MESDLGMIMEDPRMQEMIRALAKQKQRKTLVDMLNGGGTAADLAGIFPKLQAYMQQRKIKDLKEKAMLAQKKIETTQEDQLYKRAEQAYNMQQQEQMLQAARESV